MIHTDTALDLQEELPHHLSTNGLVHHFSDKLYNRLVAQVTGGVPESEDPMNEDLYNPILLTKQIPGFRQLPFVRFTPIEVI